MKHESRFEELANRARSEEPPHVDIASRVIAILSAEQNRMEGLIERPLMWFAAVSSAVAVPVVVAAVMVYNASVGPLYEISQAIAWVLQ